MNPLDCRTDCTMLRRSLLCFAVLSSKIDLRLHGSERDLSISFRVTSSVRGFKRRRWQVGGVVAESLPIRQILSSIRLCAFWLRNSTHRWPSPRR